MTDATSQSPLQPQGLATLFVEHAPALVAWLKLRSSRILGQLCEVEDIAQEVWLRAVARAREHDPHRSAFRTWLFGIAANVLLELRRGSLRLARVQIADGGSSAVLNLQQVPDTVTSITSRFARNEALDTLLAELERRGETDRRVFQLRGLEGRSHAAVAELLGLSVEAVTKRWLRLLEFLRTTSLPRGLLAD